MRYALLILALGCKQQGATSTGDTTDTTDTVTDTADTVTDTTTQAPECSVPFETSTCWDTTLEGCALPTEPGDDNLPFLNQCSDSDYVLIDNAARIPSSTWVPGDPLPPLP